MLAMVGGVWLTTVITQTTMKTKFNLSITSKMGKCGCAYPSPLEKLVRNVQGEEKLELIKALEKRIAKRMADAEEKMNLVKQRQKHMIQSANDDILYKCNQRLWQKDCASRGRIVIHIHILENALNKLLNK